MAPTASLHSTYTAQGLFALVSFGSEQKRTYNRLCWTGYSEGLIGNRTQAKVRANSMSLAIVRA